MAMKYQKGTVYLRGRKVKMWYGRYTTYLRNEEGKEVGKRRNVPLCPKANTPKWKAEQMLHALILKETGVPAKDSSAVATESVTFRWFVEERYLPMRQGSWSPAYRKINTYEIHHYLIGQFGRVPLEKMGTFEIQVWLNNLAAKFSHSVVHHCYTNMRSILHMAKKQKFLAEDIGEDVTMPQTKPVEKPLMTQEQILALVASIQDLHDLCLMCIGIFCGPRSSEVLGLQWKSWTGTTLVPYGTVFEGEFYPGRFKTRASQAPIGVPEAVRPVIEAWRRACPDPSPEALMFSTFGRGRRKGQTVPHLGKNFLRCRIRPIARRLGIPDHLVTFQVMRRTMGTDLQHYGTLKDAQGALRHASIKTTGDVYMQSIEASVLDAMNARTKEILSAWKPALLPNGNEMKEGTEGSSRRDGSSRGAEQLSQLGPSSEGRVLVSA
jgi:integrase